MINLIIDRVNSVNVFNIIDTNKTTSTESHLQSTMDEDLVVEYISEIENLIKVSNALSKNSFQNSLKTDVLTELKILGETFFNQFFPHPIQEKLRLTTDKNLHFNIDPKLSVIPWELLHDGDCFLSDKFFIGKTVKGEFGGSKIIAQEKIRMVIIADPTEDLEWAQKEGEILFKELSSKIPSSKLEIEFIGGKQITKLKLLSLIKGKNIIHYSGHLSFSDDPLENGWLLSDNKILKAREIKNSGFITDLVFSNSCQSNSSVSKNLNTNLMNFFAGSFIMSGIKCFIGTNWEIIDNQNTIDFTVEFYKHLFADKTVGESLYLAKEFSRRKFPTNDLTWTNYSLHGVPDYQLIDSAEEEAGPKIINPKLIYNNYPTPIARSYFNLIETQKNEKHNQDQLLQLLIISFENFSKVLGAIIFSDHYKYSLGREIPNNPDDALNVSEWWDLIFNCLKDFKKLEISPIMKNLQEVLHINKDIIFKLITWIQIINKNTLEEDAKESYLVTFQYYFENLLIELDEFRNIQIFLISSKSSVHYFFKGIKPDASLIGAPMIKEDFISEQIDKYRGKLIIFSESKKSIIPMICSMIENQDSGELELTFPGFKSSLKPTSQLK